MIEVQLKTIADNKAILQEERQQLEHDIEFKTAKLIELNRALSKLAKQENDLRRGEYGN